MRSYKFKAYFPALFLVLLFVTGIWLIKQNKPLNRSGIEDENMISSGKIQLEHDVAPDQFLPIIAQQNWGFACDGLNLADQTKNNYYVSTSGWDHPTQPGSARNPWQSISFAIDRVPDNSTIWVAAGQYNGQVNLVGKFVDGVTVRSCIPYQAKLRDLNNADQVVICFKCQGITLEGFDIAHSGPVAGIYVIQIQDLLKGENGPDDHVQNIVLRNNIIHDSYNNDLVKINNGARNIVVEGNMFYNQQGLDSHVDLNGVQNVVVQDNLFFNDFKSSGRVNQNDTGSFLVIKDSNGDDDEIIGASHITVRRNIFFNWEGEATGNAFISIGEDEKRFFQAFDVRIENNLFLGNSPNLMRAAFSVRGSKDISFRNNSIAGNLPSFAYGFRLSKHAINPQNQNISFFNNIWSDPTGTMGSEDPADWKDTDFSDTAPEDTATFQLDSNLYWNGGEPVFNDSEELINISDDLNSKMLNPEFRSQSSIVIPVWQPATATFADGSKQIRDVFVSIIQEYGTPGIDETVLNQGNTSFAPVDDIFGNLRDPLKTSLGAVEKNLDFDNQHNSN